MCKNKMSILIIICFMFFFTSCSFKSSNKNSVIEPDDKTMLVATIPQEFTCFGESYFSNNEEIETLTFGIMIGYLVNENELDFWKNNDNNNNLVYAFDQSNSVFRHTYESNLGNRFELYSQDEKNDCLAIKNCTGSYKLYYRQGGEL